ncbi:MAG: Arylsulfatase [Verrucomicrobiota bacterium]|jgi:arylsulfatase A-like enzyme
MPRLLRSLAYLLLGPFAAAYAADAARPNIIFIYADDLGWGDVACHGAEDWIRTPRIDRLAAEGADFAQFNVLSPVCSPSRVAAMTGRFPARYGVNNVFNSQTLGPKKGGTMPDWLDPEAPTLPRFLKAAGYRTLHFGKWHMGADQRLAPDAPPMSAYGIDESKVYHGPGPSIGLHDIGVEAAQAIGRLKAGPPFFMNVWLHESHTMHIPSQESLDAFKHLDPRRQVYAAVLREADLNVGRILDALKQHGMDENTLVIFSSDNGPAGHPVAPGDRAGQPADGNQKKGFDVHYSVGSTGGLRGRKGQLYEGGIRVPFLVRWPARIQAGLKDDRTVLSAVDLLPTLCAAAGAPLPSDYPGDGENLLPALLGKPTERTKPLFWKHYVVNKGADSWAAWAMREGRWKLLTDLSGERCALYDLVADRAEAKDVGAAHPEVVARLKPQLMAWTRSLPTSADPRCLQR